MVTILKNHTANRKDNMQLAKNVQFISKNFNTDKFIEAINCRVSTTDTA